jgi:hypothetical protein
VKAGVIEAPKAPEKLAASVTPINQAVAATGNFPKMTEEAGGEAVATSSDDATQPLVLAEREVIVLGGKLSSPKKESAIKELNTASDKDPSKFAASTTPVASDSAAAPEAAKVEEKAGELLNVLREADQAVPEELLKFGTHAGKEATFDKTTFDEEAVSSFVLKNKLSLVITFSHETGRSICKGCASAVRVVQVLWVLLFAGSEEYEKIHLVYKETVKETLGVKVRDTSELVLFDIVQGFQSELAQRTAKAGKFLK